MIGDTRFIGYCAVFKVRGEAPRPPTTRGKPSEPPADAGLSKLNSMWAAPRRVRGDDPRVVPRGERAACQVRSTFLVRSARQPEGDGDRAASVEDAP